jgi:hypothetical protein
MVVPMIAASEEELGKIQVGKDSSLNSSPHRERASRVGGLHGLLNLLAKSGDVELQGATPVPYDERTETNYFNIFTLWFCMSCNPLPYVTGPT